MKNKNCICDSRDFGGDIGPEVVTALEDKKSGYIGSITTSLSLSGFIIASLMMLMVWIFSSSGRQHSPYLCLSFNLLYDTHSLSLEVHPHHTSTCDPPRCVTTS
jgi:hypothetical protein